MDDEPGGLLVHVLTQPSHLEHQRHLALTRPAEPVRVAAGHVIPLVVVRRDEEHATVPARRCVGAAPVGVVKRHALWGGGKGWKRVEEDSTQAHPFVVQFLYVSVKRYLEFFISFAGTLWSSLPSSV